MDTDEIKVSKIAHELHANILKELQYIIDSDGVANLHSLLSDLGQFQAVPQLLDPYLNEYVTLIVETYIEGNCNNSLICEIFYRLGKTVGFKKISNYMKTEIHLIPRIITRFSSELHWHEEYLLLCWLCVLVLAPFKLDSLHSTTKNRLYEIGFEQLSKIGPTQPLGSRLLGSLIMRSDAEEEFKEFLNLQSNYSEFDTNSKSGYLQALNIALQRDLNNGFEKESLKLFEFFVRIKNDDSVNTDLLAKIISKLGPYLAELEEFEKVEEIIQYFIDNFQNRNTETRFILARKYAKLVGSLEHCLAIEAVLDLVTSTQELIQQPLETINADVLHSDLLAMAEMIRLGALYQYSQEDLTTIISKTFFFQQSRITYISGSNIRDASNYVAWSMAKYHKYIDPALAYSIFSNLVFVSCFDKDIIIRRSAAAALQELVGRHGTNTWNQILTKDVQKNAPRNMGVSSALDYVDLGSIEKSYLDIPLKVLKVFPELRSDLLTFLCNNCYNIDKDLAKLSSKALAVLLSGDENEIQKSISYHVEKSAISQFNAFLALSDILPLTSNHAKLSFIIPIFDKVKINNHKDHPFTLETYLLLLKSLLIVGYTPTEETLDNVFSAIRLENSGIKRTLKEIASNLKLNDFYWKKWLTYINFNNSNASSSVAHLPRFAERTDEVLRLLSSDKTDANAKSEVIKSISLFLQTRDIPKDSLRYLVESLDDYSVTEQGDVGSKVRLAAIELITRNFIKFAPLRSIIEPKLLRLSVEPMDRIRHNSARLIQKIVEDFEGVFENNEFHFEKMLNIYSKHYKTSESLSKEFWRGYCFSGGALKATDDLISSSLKAFLSFYADFDEKTKSKVLLELAANLKVDSALFAVSTSRSQRLHKLIHVGLLFYSRILTSNIMIPEGFNMKGLYIRVYNSHLNTKNVTRLKASIDIFGYLALVHDIEEAQQRLKFLIINHQIARVRILAAEELFNVYNERSRESGEYNAAMDILESVDWNDKNVTQYQDLI
ncbi:hypothetical protein WICMUC_004440 [Wickerhamomyces mucosus]|uniref:Tubulin-folding cofactor D ARM repeats domain-containing protein n=1 Tax=Wickerhamomyces mucosus TaxID=1378264 RepID=A0A9P8TB85_9ASCO|nr:hypothetical protein WICMUC_004440 [Wickerhamomyces mucosus]